MVIFGIAKKFLPQSIVTTLVIASSAVISTPAFAADFDFNGSLAKIDQVLLFDFSIDSEKEVTIFSSSAHEENGFDTILSIWDSNGNLIAEQDDGYNTGSTVSNGVSYNHGWLDSYFTRNLQAGSYKASVTAYPNFAKGANISDGFELESGGRGPRPYGESNSNWRFHLLNVEQAGVRIVDGSSQSVPEPASMLGLVAVTSVGAASLKRKLAKANKG